MCQETTARVHGGEGVGSAPPNTLVSLDFVDGVSDELVSRERARAVSQLKMRSKWFFP